VTPEPVSKRDHDEEGHKNGKETGVKERNNNVDGVYGRKYATTTGNISSVVAPNEGARFFTAMDRISTRAA